ncbi:MAG TPA: hypothetical protein VND91_01985 [Candidatus Saccharimonadia bacterium]|nr:hypothetical protein [Candidatus Saccharimonadia bacterium]
MPRRLLCLLLALVAPAASACLLHRAQSALEQAKGSVSEFAARMPAKALTPAWVGPGYSGSWYDPARAGEGFTLEILEDGSAVVVWFTFPPAGSTARQSWILGQNGRVSANRIVFEDVYTARGARFGAAFNPAAVALTRWGRLEFTFSSCTQGAMTYQGASGFGSGGHTLQRLTTLDELDCNGARRVNAAGARATSALRNYAGAFVDPARAGEGWVIEPFSPTQAGAYWFTYDGNGEQAWLLGIGTLSGNRLRIDSALRPVGTAFGAGFNAASVERTNWGNVEFEFDTCNSTTVRYGSSAAGFDSGALRAQRLTRLASATCLDAIRPARASGTWSAGPSMAVAESENAVVLLDGKVYSAGGFLGHRTFQRLDLATGSWQVLAPLPDGRDHALSVAYAGGVYVFGGFPGGQGDPGASWRYDVATNVHERLPGVFGVGASGAALLNGQFYLGSDSGEMIQYDPRSGLQRNIPRFGPRMRDHSQVVAYLGEIWMIGGREFNQFGPNMQNDVTIFDPVSETWRAGPRMVRSHSGFAAAVLEDQIFVAGGEFTASGGVIPNLEVIGPGESVWTLGPNMPIPVHGFQGVAHGGRFITIGGSTIAGQGGGNGAVQIYTPN